MSCDAREWVEVETIPSPITFGSRGQSFAYVEALGPVFLQAVFSFLSLPMRRNHVWKPINNETHKIDIANKRERSPPKPQILAVLYSESPIDAILCSKAWKNPM